MVLMETIYPQEGKSVFDDPKLAKELAKEMKKGTIRKPTPSDAVDVDEDLDSKLLAAVAEVWSFYDPKGVGTIQKKMALKFFEDALDLYAFRKGVKEKEVMGQGVSKKKALDDCFNLMSGNGQAVSKQQFEAYIHCNDLEEAMAPLTGRAGGLEIRSRLPPNLMFDPNTLPKEASGVDMTNIQYRDYNQTLEV